MLLSHPAECGLEEYRASIHLGDREHTQDRPQQEDEQKQYLKL